MATATLLLDVHNLYVGVQRRFPGKVINYPKLLEVLTTSGHDIVSKVAYGNQDGPEVRSFIGMLRANGFKTVFSKNSHNIEMALEAASATTESVILGTNYFEVIHILNHLKRVNRNALVIGNKIPNLFTKAAAVWELDESVLTDKRKPEEVIMT